IAETGREDRSISIVLVNIKRFKDINDSFGRDVGDSLLQQVAGRSYELYEVIGCVDFPARIGADTFVWVFYRTSCDLSNTQFVRDSINQIFSRPFILAGIEIQLGTYAGMACFPDHGGDAESLFNNAEAALKHARDQHESLACYSPEFHARVTERLTMESKLRRAIEQEEFVLYFQPKVEVVTGNITGLEALIRWNDPEAGMVPPLAFIPLLEETGMIIQVGRWLMHETARIVSGWHARGLPLVPIAVNISPIELRRPDFVQSVEETLKSWPADAPRFSLEITESAIMADIIMIGPKLKAIEQMGVEIAIDDFGTGYSSLAYLAELPACVVKIDRSFIHNIDTNEEHKTIVTQIISLAHALNKAVVAEGVETEGQLACLRQLQCEQYQGYLLSRPEPAEKIEKLLLQENSRRTGELPRAVNCCAWPPAAGLVQAC
ncbi:MAG: putative bifunctional diguanylate cyclase/phosphodiesterase, partial [Gammaproteobacteria bacterium]